MRFTRVLPLTVAVLLGTSLVGCGDPPRIQPGESTSSIWIASEPASGLPLTELDSAAFFDHPWPSDLRLDNGKVKLTNFPNPRYSTNIESYIEYMDGVLDGFSPAAAGHMRFTAPINVAQLPLAANGDDTLRPDSVVQLIDIDSLSPEYGQRKYVSVQFREAEGVYYSPNTLAFMPSPGYPLRPHTRYAFVVTDALLDIFGQPVTKSHDLAEVLGDTPTTGAATAQIKTTLEPALVEIEKAGIKRKNIVHLAVFTTNDPTEELFALRDHLRANVAAPNVDPSQWHIVATSDISAEYVGMYGPSPNYQDGNIPYSNPKDGGAFKYVGGEPVVHDLFSLRFSLTIPTADECPMPTNGYPIVLYAHGTGGNFRSYVRDGTALSLAEHCIASMGVDQIFHGTRAGAPAPDEGTAIALRFFNVNNVVAARTSNRQSALDEVQRARLFTETKIQIPKDISVWGEAITFDPSRVMFFGHSQGGLNGPLFLASDNQALGGVLSGSGALMSITLTEKTSPDPSVAYIVKTLMLKLQGDEELAEVDMFHPALAFAQTLVDVTDPIHYARHIIAEPRPTMNPKSIYMTVGIDSTGNGDTYAPPRGIEMHAVAMGLPLITNGQTWEIPEMKWKNGPQTLTLADKISDMIPTPTIHNLANGKATGGIAEWKPAKGSDGHFVIFDIPEATEQADWFLKTLGGDGTAQLIDTSTKP